MKVKIEIYTSDEKQVIRMLRKYDHKNTEVSRSGYAGSDAPSIKIFTHVEPTSIKPIINDLEIINRNGCFTGLGNYPSIKEYI